MRIVATCLGVLMMTAAGWAETGSAFLVATSSSSAVHGTVTLADQPNGLHVQAQISGATPGNHAFHIHEFGACGDQGKAAGSHYNPRNTPHGMVMKDGVMHAHAGDMGNVQVNAQGEAVVDVVVPGVSLSGAEAVGGRAIVLHEKIDDFSQPAGNAGGRIACGTIVITGK